MTVEVRGPGPSKQKSRITLWTYNFAKPRSFFVCFGQHINKPKSVTSRLESLSEHAALDDEFTNGKLCQPYCAAFPPRKTRLPGHVVARARAAWRLLFVTIAALSLRPSCP